MFTSLQTQYHTWFVQIIDTFEGLEEAIQSIEQEEEDYKKREQLAI